MYDQDFVKSVMNKLDLLNAQNGIQPGDFQASSRGYNRRTECLPELNILDSMGRSALNYIERKEQMPIIAPDPLFPDRN
jgi:hypothetical protein